MSKFDNKEELKADEIEKDTSVSPKNRKNHNKMLSPVTIFLLLVFSGLSAVGVYEYHKLKIENEKNIADIAQKMNSLANYVNERLDFVDKDVDKLKSDFYHENNEKDIKSITDIAITTLENQLSQLKMQITQDLENKIDQNIATAKSETIIKKEETHIAQEILLASGALVVRDLAELGEDFRYECEVMQILSQGNELAQNYTAALRIHALNGVNGKNKLIKDFNKVYANLGETKLKQENTLVKNYAEMDWAEKIIYYLRKYSILKKATHKPLFKAQEDEVYQLVNEGELREALTAIKNSEKYNRINSSPLNEWMKNAENYLDFRHLIDSLLMNSLANLHLKEMEH